MTNPYSNNPHLREAVLAAERGVIGACIVAPRLLRDLELGTEDFADHKHRAVWQALRNLEAVGRPIDTLSVELEMEHQGVVGFDKLSTLIDLTLAPPVVEHVREYARAVADSATKRRIAIAIGELLQRAGDPRVTGDELLAEATFKLGAIDGPEADVAVTIGDLAIRRMQDLERYAREREHGREALTGAPTGVRSLDRKIGGWQFGIVNLIAARPGMGKSALALATADASSASGKGVHAFSLEDSWHAYTDRQLARDSQMPAVKIRCAEFTREELSNMAQAMRKLRLTKNWIVDERGGLSAREIVRSVRRHAPANGTRVVIVDYIQLCRPHDPRAREDQQLGDSIGVFAEAAKADDMAYLVLSQLNRELEKRTDKRPQLSDLRGSGELEEKCKVAVGLYRGAYYGGKPRRDVDYDCDCDGPKASCKHTPSDFEFERQVQCLVLKGGNGPTGRVWATWDGPTVRIS